MIMVSINTIFFSPLMLWMREVTLMFNRQFRSSESWWLFYPEFRPYAISGFSAKCATASFYTSHASGWLSMSVSRRRLRFIVYWLRSLHSSVFSLSDINIPLYFPCRVINIEYSLSIYENSVECNYKPSVRMNSVRYSKSVRWTYWISVWPNR